MKCIGGGWVKKGIRKRAEGSTWNQWECWKELMMKELGAGGDKGTN